MFNKISNLFLKINLYSFESYSLEGEDRLISRYFESKNSGFYIDIGSNHPLRFNNTFIFFKKGWKGVNVDADEESINLFRRYRKSDINICSAVGNSSKLTNYYRFNDSALNTFDENYHRHYQEIGYKLLGTSKLKVRKLSEILSKLQIPKKIDFMSIDVEGKELDVLKSNNWEKYRPKLIIVEVFNIIDFKSANSNKITTYLKSKKYRLFAKTLSNLIYINEK